MPKRIPRYRSLALCLLLPVVLALLGPAGLGQALAAGWTGPENLVPTHIPPYNPGGLLKPLLLLTFFIHILLVNILVGSTFLALVSSGRRKAEPSFSMREETGFITTVLALAVNLGIAPYLFMQVLYGNFFFSSTLLMSLWWLALIGFIMLAYYGLYIVSDKAAANLPRPRALLGIIVLLLAATAFVLTNNTSLMLRPENWLGWMQSPGGTLLNTADPTLIPRYLHMLMAMIGTGGLVYALRARRSGKKAAIGAEEEERRVSYGLDWYTFATLIGAAFGVWFLGRLPEPIRERFLGGDFHATALLCTASLGVIAALILARMRRLSLVCGVSAGVLFLMISMRDVLREALLAPYAAAGHEPAALLLDKGQAVGFIVFLLSTAFAVGAIIYMIRAALRETPATEPTPADARQTGGEE